MSVEKLKTLGKKILGQSSEQDEELLESFVEDLELTVQSMDALIAELEASYEMQVESKKTGTKRLLSVLPSPLKPQFLKVQEDRLKELKLARQKVKAVSEALEGLQSSLVTVDEEKTAELGKRVYELSYPGEEIISSKLEELEQRMENLERNHIKAMEEIHQQMQQLHHALQRLAVNLQEQGVKIEEVEGKIQEVDSRLEKIEGKLEKVVKAMVGKKFVLGVITGVITTLLAVILLLSIV